MRGRASSLGADWLRDTAGGVSMDMSSREVGVAGRWKLSMSRRWSQEQETVAA